MAPVRFELTTWSLGETRSSNWATESCCGAGGTQTRDRGIRGPMFYSSELQPQIGHYNGHYRIARSPVIYKISCTGCKFIFLELNINK